jgi:hypothetical protein
MLQRDLAVLRVRPDALVAELARCVRHAGDSRGDGGDRPSAELRRLVGEWFSAQARVLDYYTVGRLLRSYGGDRATTARFAVIFVGDGHAVRIRAILDELRPLVPASSALRRRAFLEAKDVLHGPFQCLDVRSLPWPPIGERPTAK